MVDTDQLIPLTRSHTQATDRSFCPCALPKHRNGSIHCTQICNIMLTQLSAWCCCNFDECSGSPTVTCYSGLETPGSADCVLGQSQRVSCRKKTVKRFTENEEKLSRSQGQLPLLSMLIEVLILLRLMMPYDNGCWFQGLSLRDRASAEAKKSRPTPGLVSLPPVRTIGLQCRLHCVFIAPKSNTV